MEKKPCITGVNALLHTTVKVRALEGMKLLNLHIGSFSKFQTQDVSLLPRDRLNDFMEDEAEIHLHVYRG